MQSGRVILSPERFDIVLRRLAHQLLENYDDFENTCVIGIQEKGVILGQQLKALIEEEDKREEEILFGKLDISFYRDDFRSREIPIKVSPTDIEFSLDGKKVILIDDVLYTGRTIQAALSALQDFGRPSQVDLLVMVDRRFKRQVPIQPDYYGIVVDAFDNAYVRVIWNEKTSKHKVQIFSAETEEA